MATLGTLSVIIDSNTMGYVKGLNKAQALTSKFGVATKSAMSTVGGAFRTLMGPVGMLTTALGGLSAAFVAKDIIATGAQFEQTMKTVGGVSRTIIDGQVTPAFQALEDIAREMGEQTEWSATQAAEGLKFLSMAGFESTESVKALPGVLDLATAGGIDLGRAADIASNALTAMRLPIEDLNKVNDVFVKTITTSNTNMEMMAESFKYAAPVAASYGYEIDQVSGYIGLLGNAGIQGSMAGTSLARSFQEVTKVFDHFGVTAGGASGYTNDLSGAIKLLNEKSAEAADQTEFTSEVMQLFGQRAGKAVLALMGQGTEAVEQYIKAVGDSSGAAKSLADTMRNTVGGAWKEFKSAIESVKIDIFDTQVDSLKETLKGLTQWVRDNKDAIVEFGKDLASAMGLVAVAFKGAFEAISLAWNILAAVPKGILEYFSELKKSSISTREQMAGDLKIMREAVSAAKERIKALQEQMEEKVKLGADVSGIETEIGDAQKVVEALQEAMEERMEMHLSVSETQKALKIAQKELEKTKGRFEEVKKAADKLSEPTTFDEFVAQLQIVGTAIDDFVIAALHQVGTDVALLVGDMVEGFKVVWNELGFLYKSIKRLAEVKLSLNLSEVKQNVKDAFEDIKGYANDLEQDMEAFNSNVNHNWKVAVDQTVDTWKLGVKEINNTPIEMPKGSIEFLDELQTKTKTVADSMKTAIEEIKKAAMVDIELGLEPTEVLQEFEALKMELEQEKANLHLGLDSEYTEKEIDALVNEINKTEADLKVFAKTDDAMNAVNSLRGAIESPATIPIGVDTEAAKKGIDDLVDYTSHAWKSEEEKRAQMDKEFAAQSAKNWGKRSYEYTAKEKSEGATTTGTIPTELLSELIAKLKAKEEAEPSLPLEMLIRRFEQQLRISGDKYVQTLESRTPRQANYIPGFQQGSGAIGLSKSGIFEGHLGEIVASKEASEAVRAVGAASSALGGGWPDNMVLNRDTSAIASIIGKDTGRHATGLAGLGETGSYYGSAGQIVFNPRESDKIRNEANNLPSFQLGTGIRGIPVTGPYIGHTGEIVLNREQSNKLRTLFSGGYQPVGGSLSVPTKQDHYHITINSGLLGDKQFMSSQALAEEVVRIINERKVRFGILNE